MCGTIISKVKETVKFFGSILRTIARHTSLEQEMHSFVIVLLEVGSLKSFIKLATRARGCIRHSEAMIVGERNNWQLGIQQQSLLCLEHWTSVTFNQEELPVGLLLLALLGSFMAGTEGDQSKPK